jgi:SAM-dependent methyltransferase
MGDDGGAATYILGTEERRRLELLEHCLDPITTRSLDAIGVEAGWRCLELGAGGGSVTRMLCDRVGPAGRVAAVDLDTRFVEEINADNLDVHRSDVVAEGLPGDGYDLVHARLLLMHLPTREKLLEEMAATLRPGGWLLVDEMDVFPLPVLAEGPMLEVWTAVVAAFEAAQACPTFGRDLPPLFDRAGLEAVEAVCDVPTFRGGAPFTQMIMASVAQVRPFIAVVGITEEHIASLERQLADTTQWFSAFALYSVRGRAPAA